jgi:hypothetical protein
MSEHSSTVYMTTKEIADRLGVSTQMVLIYAKRQGLIGQVRRVGRAYLFPSELAETIVRRPPGRPRREY